MSKIFYYLLIAILVLGVFSAIWRARAQKNLTAIDKWMLQMDVTAHGKRYQGERSTLLYVFNIEKIGLATVKTKRLYRTVSGRYFEIEITSEFSEVNQWDLQQVPKEDGDAFVEDFCTPGTASADTPAAVLDIAESEKS
jgi:hypothetical protein